LVFILVPSNFLTVMEGILSPSPREDVNANELTNKRAIIIFFMINLFRLKIPIIAPQ
jgi:hypothetical protein